MIGYIKPMPFDRIIQKKKEEYVPSQSKDETKPRWPSLPRYTEDTFVYEYTDPDTGEKQSVEADLEDYSTYCCNEAWATAQLRVLHKRHAALMEQERTENEALMPKLTEELKAADAELQKHLDASKQYPSFQEYYNAHCEDYEYANEAYEELEHRLWAAEADEKRWSTVRKELEDTQLPNTMEGYIEASYLGTAFFTERVGREQYYCIDFGGKHLQAKTVEELRKLVSIEEDRINRENGYSLLTNRSIGTISEAKRRIASLSATDSIYILEMFYQTVFGEKEEREAARLRIYRTLFLEKQQQDVNEKDMEKALHEKLEDLAQQEEVSMQKVDKFTFFNYMREYLENRKVITQVSLAKKLGCHHSNISHIKNGDLKTLKRKWVVGMAVAFGMNKEDMRRFIRSAGFAFPCYKNDYIIEQRIERGVRDYYAIMANLEEQEQGV